MPTAADKGGWPIGDIVQIDGQDMLTLCEVQVYGRVPLKTAPIECGAASVTGAWEFKKSSSTEAEFTYTVVQHLILGLKG